MECEETQMIHLLFAEDSSEMFSMEGWLSISCRKKGNNKGKCENLLSFAKLHENWFSKHTVNTLQANLDKKKAHNKTQSVIDQLISDQFDREQNKKQKNPKKSFEYLLGSLENYS